MRLNFPSEMDDFGRMLYLCTQIAMDERIRLAKWQQLMQRVRGKKKPSSAVQIAVQPKQLKFKRCCSPTSSGARAQSNCKT